MHALLVRLLLVGTLLLAALGAGGSAPAFASDAVLKVYDIGFLTSVQQDLPGPSLAGDPQEPVGPIAVEPSPSFLSPEEIVEAIKTNFFEDSWADSAHSIRADRGTLVVVNRPEVHEVIDRYLATLRALRGRLIRIDARLLELSPSVLEALEAAGAGTAARAAAGGFELSDAQVAVLDAALRRVDDARLVHAAQVAGFSGQRVHTQNLREKTIVQDYNVSIAAGGSIARPITALVSEGSVLDVVPVLEFGDTRVTLCVRFHRQVLGAPVATFDSKIAKLGLLQLPEVHHLRLKTTVTVGDGRTALCGMVGGAAAGHGGHVLALLLRPTVAKTGPAEAKAPDSEERRQFRMYDVDFLVRPIPEFPAPDLRLRRREEGGGAVGATFEGAPDVAEGLTIPIEDLVNLITSNVSPETWSNSRNHIRGSNGRLLVVQRPEVLARIQEYLASLARDRGRVITVDVVELGLAGRYAGAGLFESPLQARAGLAPEAVKALWEQAKAGTDVRVRAASSVAGFNRERVHVGWTATRSYVADHDVEVAENAQAFDPAIGRVTEGVMLDVRPTLAGDGATLLLDLRPTVSRLPKELEAFDTQATGGGRLQLPQSDIFGPELSLMVREGEWTVATVASDPTGDGHSAFLVRARVSTVK
ncbi:MAG: hypothetical protein HYZ53_22810 [Planctomycetes bacterium]|nr:hypothetical protein [Planctomycetota bacterium]